jgi:hypothetical protein
MPDSKAWTEVVEYNPKLHAEIVKSWIRAAENPMEAITLFGRALRDVFPRFENFKPLKSISQLYVQQHMPAFVEQHPEVTRQPDRVKLLMEQFNALSAIDKLTLRNELHLATEHARGAECAAKRDPPCVKVQHHFERKKRGKRQPVPCELASLAAIAAVQQHRHATSTDDQYRCCAGVYREWHAKLLGEQHQPRRFWTSAGFPPYPKHETLSFFVQLLERVPQLSLAAILNYSKALADEERLLPLVDQFFATHDWKDFRSGAKRTLGVATPFSMREFTQEQLDTVFRLVEEEARHPQRRDTVFLQVTSAHGDLRYTEMTAEEAALVVARDG